MTPWIALAATLAQNGLPNLARRVKAEPMSVVREAARVLSTADRTVPPTPAAIETAIAADPDAIAKLAEVDLSIFEAEEGSRQAARSTWAGTPMQWFLAFFATAVLAIFAGSLWFAATTEVPSPNSELYTRMQGTLENVLLIVVGFFFGAAVGSVMRSGRERP